MYFTTFRPDRHGFYFSNSQIEWSVGPFSGKALCGGMVYAALDYYVGGLAMPPPDPTPPPEGSVLQQYIFRRQLRAHYLTDARFALSFVAPDDYVQSVTQTDLQRLVPMIKQGSPTPLCLVGYGLSGHHVLAIGCSDASPFKITIYDPNYPAYPQILGEVPGQGILHNGNWGMWRGCFLNDTYTPITPPYLYGETNWRWCRKCQGLFYAGYATAGVCPAGGGHDPSCSANYILAKWAGSGQADWNKCSQCEGLFYFGDPGNAGWCPAGGIHNGRTSDNFCLAVDGGFGQSSWCWCCQCEGLFFAGNSTFGCCPCNPGGHDPTGSGNYHVPQVV